MIDYNDYFYLCPTSPTYLRNKRSRYGGKNGKTPVAVVDEVAGCVGTDGYAVVSFNNKTIKVSRLIWEMLNGSIPEGFMVDHVDGNRGNNNPKNLRIVTRQQNAQNQGLRSLAGVTLRTFNRNGKDYHYWRAGWSELDGTKCSKDFSVQKLGNNLAYRMAVEFRVYQVIRLNSEGASYTTRHFNIIDNSENWHMARMLRTMEELDNKVELVTALDKLGVDYA